MIAIRAPGAIDLIGPHSSSPGCVRRCPLPEYGVAAIAGAAAMSPSTSAAGMVVR